jgi:hypothetical protein
MMISQAHLQEARYHRMWLRTVSQEKRTTHRELQHPLLIGWLRGWQLSDKGDSLERGSIRKLALHSYAENGKSATLTSRALSWYHWENCVRLVLNLARRRLKKNMLKIFLFISGKTCRVRRQASRQPLTRVAQAPASVLFINECLQILRLYRSWDYYSLESKILRSYRSWEINLKSI